MPQTYLPQRKVNKRDGSICHPIRKVCLDLENRCLVCEPATLPINKKQNKKKRTQGFQHELHSNLQRYHSGKPGRGREAMSQMLQGQSDDDKDDEKERVTVSCKQRLQKNKDTHLSWGGNVSADAGWDCVIVLPFLLVCFCVWAAALVPQDKKINKNIM